MFAFHFVLLFSPCCFVHGTSNASTLKAIQRQKQQSMSSKPSINTRQLISTKGGHQSHDSAQNFYQWYLSSCADFPFVTKSTTCAIVCSIGDMIAQKLESYLGKEVFVVNLPRLGTFFLCGLLYVGPFVHVWYELLHELVGWMEKKYQTSKVQQIITQLCVDQTIGVAIFFPTYFYVFEYFEALLQWRTPSLKYAHQKCLEQISKVFLMQYRVFPLCNAINFSIIPKDLRVLFSNTVSLFWNIYLSTLIADHSSH